MQTAAREFDNGRKFGSARRPDPAHRLQSRRGSVEKSRDAVEAGEHRVGQFKHRDAGNAGAQDDCKQFGVRQRVSAQMAKPFARTVGRMW